MIQQNDDQPMAKLFSVSNFNENSDMLSLMQPLTRYVTKGAQGYAWRTWGRTCFRSLRRPNDRPQVIALDSHCCGTASSPLWGRQLRH